LPKSDAQSARAWLYGKLFVVLLTEQLMRQGRTLSPSAASCRPACTPQPVARIRLCSASAPAGGRPRVTVTRSDGELAHDYPSPLRMPTPTATTARPSPSSLKLTLMGGTPRSGPGLARRSGTCVGPLRGNRRSIVCGRAGRGTSS
jgi:hypothetical protein